MTEEKKDDGGPAFPVPFGHVVGSTGAINEVAYWTGGLTKRELAAFLIRAVIGTWTPNSMTAAEFACREAAALIAELKK